jgi:hypothetical protein
MNHQIRILAEQAEEEIKAEYEDESRRNRRLYNEIFLPKFAQLIVGECAKLNKHQSYELMGVITDVEEGDGFDDVCLNTVKRVAEHLAKDLKEHFGVEE